MLEPIHVAFGVAVGMMIISILYCVARSARPSVLLENEPSDAESFVVNRTPRDAFAVLQGLDAVHDYRIEISDHKQLRMVLSKPASPISFGFFIAVRCEGDDRCTRVGIGIKSRLLQDNEGNPIRAAVLAQFVERARALLATGSVKAVSSVSDAWTQGVIASSAVVLTFLGVLNLGRFLQASSAPMGSWNGIGALLSVILGGVFLLYCVNNSDHYGRIFWGSLIVGCAVAAVGQVDLGRLDWKKNTQMIVGGAYILLALLDMCLLMIARRCRIFLFG